MKGKIVVTEVTFQDGSDERYLYDRNEYTRLKIEFDSIKKLRAELKRIILVHPLNQKKIRVTVKFEE